MKCPESCRLRGGRTELIIPKPFAFTSTPAALNGKLVGVGLVKLVTFSVVLTASNCVWLNALKASRSQFESSTLFDLDALR